MNVLVDTPIWSLAFRRKVAAVSSQERRFCDELIEID